MTRPGHHSHDASHLAVAVLTVSDTRREGDDASGDAVEAAVRAAGHVPSGRGWVPDDVVGIQTTALELLDAARALVVTGGTGLGPRDVTPEAFQALFEKEWPGFGERLRHLSLGQVGERATLSRATAGFVRREDGLRPVFLLPGSPEAVALAMERLVLPLLPHVVGLQHEHNVDTH